MQARSEHASPDQIAAVRRERPDSCRDTGATTMRLINALLVTLISVGLLRAADPRAPLADWTATPLGWKGATAPDGTATLTADKWSYLLAPGQAADVEVSATLTVREPGKHKSFFG